MSQSERAALIAEIDAVLAGTAKEVTREQAAAFLGAVRAMLAADAPSAQAYDKSDDCRMDASEARLPQDEGVARQKLAEARKVPREPTEAMMQAAYEDWNDHQGAGKPRSAAEAMRARWRAMYDAALAAVPKEGE